MKFRHILIFATAIVLSTCNGPPSTPSTRTAVNKSFKWHFEEFSEVRAYRINWKDNYSFDFIRNSEGSLNPTRFPIDGIKLNETQIAKLKNAVKGHHRSHERAACFSPHHAFLFYDRKGEIVGSINICFTCSNYNGHPSGFSKEWDLGALESLFKELEIPITNPAW